MTFTTPFGFDPTFIDVMNAVSGGHFAKEGLDVKVIGPPGNAQAFQQMAAGQAQFSYIASIDFIRAVGRAQGAVLRLLVHLPADRLPDREPQGEAGASGADLKGKTIGVLSVGGLSELLVQVAMIKGGLAKTDANIVVAGNSPGEVELIRKGRLDCFICNFPLAVTLQRMGEPLEYLDIDSVVQGPGLVLFCTHETAETKPDVVLRFLRGVHASILELIAEPLAPIFQRAGKDFEIPRINDMAALIAVQQEVTKHQWLVDGRENLMRNQPRLWQSAVDGLRSIGIADVKDPATLYTNKFIDQLPKA